MITVLLVDDHADLRKNLQYLIEKSDDIQVMATASSGIEAVAQASSRCPDIIVMDISMPQMDGIEATRQILAHCPVTRVLMLSTYDNPDYIRRAVEVGARGYVLKDAAGEDLLEAIHTIHRGSNYFSENLGEIAKKYLARKGNDSSAV